MMKHNKNKIYSKDVQENIFTKVINLIGLLTFTFLILSSVTACTDFVEVDPPKNTLISETVFEEVATVEAAFANIYSKMRDDGMLYGFGGGISFFMGSYCDELDYLGTDVGRAKFYQHNVSASENVISEYWSHAYNLIYAANDIIKGVDNSSALSIEDKDQFKGQALFVRAYLHSLLVALYGDIPYITTTDYLDNSTASRMAVNTVYDNIIADLTNAIGLLEDTDPTGERVVPNQSAATALLARVYLYTENWVLAEATVNELIGSYNLESDITKVFLKDSPETLWQFKPRGVNSFDINAKEPTAFVIHSLPWPEYSLANNFLTAFEFGDLRHTNWVGSFTDGTVTLYYPHKYKARGSQAESLEYSIIFRLTEQYLIRAEARAHQGNIAGTQQDLNAIRNRAGLPDTTASTMNDLLDAILQERRVELFTEHGQRWFDLKRTGNASTVLSPIKPNWKDTDVLLPIPENELELNSNLAPQNDGY